MIRSVVQIVLGTNGGFGYRDVLDMELSFYLWVVQELNIYASRQEREANKESMQAMAMADPAIRTKIL